MGTIIMDRNQPNKNIIKIRINQPIAPQPHQYPHLLFYSHPILPSSHFQNTQSNPISIDQLQISQLKRDSCVAGIYPSMFT